MHPILQANRVLPADRLIVPKSNWRVVQHHALYLGQNFRGQDLIIENKIGYGVRLITADIFFRDVVEITRIERFVGNNYKRKQAVQKSLQQIGRPYSLINYNCQHFANEIQYGKIKSEQVDNFLEGVTVTLGISLFIGLIGAITSD